MQNKNLFIQKVQKKKKSVFLSEIKIDKLFKCRQPQMKAVILLPEHEII